jgi:large subunit ribosomal protein L5
MSNSHLQEHYRKTVAPKLQKELGVKNIHAVPRLAKIVVNVGLGTYLKGTKDYEPITESIKTITGQKPAVKLAKKSISNFKLRKGTPAGLTVTLRGARAYDFLNKLINVVFPRVRDFRGVPKKILDGKGNVTVGFKENIVFPEINPDQADKTHGLEVSIVTTAKEDDGAYALLKAFGFPFRGK